MTRFHHLKELNVSYTTHFKHSMYYSFTSLKSSYYFFIHAVYPDIYVTDGSETITKLHKVISENKKKYPKK